MTQKRRRVVVTGLGMVTPLGNEVATTWSNILASRSGVTLYEEQDISNYPCRFYAGVKNFDPSLYLSPRDVRVFDTFVQYGVGAASQAFEDAGLVITEQNAQRCGVVIGSGIGGLSYIENNHDILYKSGPRKVSPYFIAGGITNMISGQVSIKYGLQGPSFAVVSACTTGTHNIGEAFRLIQSGDADVILAGGSEKSSSPLGLAGFAAVRALSTRNDNPQAASRPWDRDRDGFVLGDGAGVVVLEEYEHAKARGAKIYAELCGYGMSSDAYHFTGMPQDGRGAVAAMRNSLRDAEMAVEEIDYINAHATSTQLGDVIESNAIKTVFGEHAYKLAVSSTKSMTGHLLGAAGAVEAIFAILALRDQIAPPTINLENPSEGCDLNYVPGVPQERKIAATLSNSFGFGGTNASLVFRALT